MVKPHAAPPLGHRVTRTGARHQVVTPGKCRELDIPHQRGGDGRLYAVPSTGIVLLSALLRG